MQTIAELLQQADEIIEHERLTHSYYTDRGFARVKNREAELIKALVEIIREKEDK